MGVTDELAGGLGSRAGLLRSKSESSCVLTSETTVGEVATLDPRELLRTAQLERVEAVSSPADEALC